MEKFSELSKRWEEYEASFGDISEFERPYLKITWDAAVTAILEPKEPSLEEVLAIGILKGEETNVTMLLDLLLEKGAIDEIMRPALIVYRGLLEDLLKEFRHSSGAYGYFHSPVAQRARKALSIPEPSEASIYDY